jgi:hypothetical protein
MSQPLIKQISTEAMLDELKYRFDDVSIELCKNDGEYRKIYYSVFKGEYLMDEPCLVKEDEEQEGA